MAFLHSRLLLSAQPINSLRTKLALNSTDACHWGRRG